MKIAIIGSGISGLSAAYILGEKHDVHVFEKNNYVGGHSRTINLNLGNETVPVDTGFIVFNKENYPHLTAFFNQLEVPIAKSNMSFGATIKKGHLEYGSNHLLAQKRNLLRPKFWGMLFDILKFNKTALKILESDENITLGEYLDRMHMGAWFRQYYLEAMGGAIWSCPVETIQNYPAQSFIRFFKNHGLLTVNNHPQWYTVQGGSCVYIDRILKQNRFKIHLEKSVRGVKADKEGGCILNFNQNENHTLYFDAVVFACHADTALKILKNPSAAQHDILSAFQYQKNEVVVHTDETFMPKRKKAWSSWVYINDDDHKDTISLSYWMNNLQPLKTKDNIFVTLNPSRAPNKKRILDRHYFDHPIFTTKTQQAQKRIKTIQGKNNMWFCGAYLGYGFHEDGLKSTIDVLEEMGEKIPWL